MRTLKLITIIFSISLLASCAHMNSGHHIQLTNEDNLESLSKELNVSPLKLQEFNPGKTFKAGEWVFVPLKRGIIANTRGNRSPASFESANEENTNLYLASGQFIWPVPSSKRISSNFGHRWGRKHEGIDIAARKGAHFVSAADGVVVYSGRELGGYGNLTVVAHEDGFFTVYGHADKNLTYKGQKVFQGQVIGHVGSTGRSTGNHLHFEIRHNSKALNPAVALGRN